MGPEQYIYEQSVLIHPGKSFVKHALATGRAYELCLDCNYTFFPVTDNDSCPYCGSVNTIPQDVI